MNTVPGLPVLRSRDLVNWRLIAHALPRLVPDDVFSTVQPGKGVWAPSIRHHDGKFWIYWGDPDFGIYVVTATNPEGPWSAPVLVEGGEGPHRSLPAVGRRREGVPGARLGAQPRRLCQRADARIA